MDFQDTSNNLLRNAIIAATGSDFNPAELGTTYQHTSNNLLVLLINKIAELKATIDNGGGSTPPANTQSEIIDFLILKGEQKKEIFSILLEDEFQTPPVDLNIFSFFVNLNFEMVGQIDKADLRYEEQIQNLYKYNAENIKIFSSAQDNSLGISREYVFPSDYPNSMNFSLRVDKEGYKKLIFYINNETDLDYIFQLRYSYTKVTNWHILSVESEEAKLQAEKDALEAVKQ
jgi:hypothetical protein